ILKVYDIRENRGEILVAHIMKMFPQGGATPEIKAQLKTEINGIYKELLAGADFAELAKAKSDDKRSAVKGGEMPWFANGRMIKEFANAAFDIKEKGDFTKPIETKFGYHIIKKLDERGVESFEESKEDIENRIKRDPARSITSKTAFTNKLKAEYNFSENSAGIENLKGKKIGDRFENVIFDLFILNGKTYNFGGLRRYIQNNNITKGTYTANFSKWVADEITNLEDSRLEDKYPDFRYLMQEYHDGILLFNISEDKIWNRAVEDSVGLETFYEKNSKKYSWEERFKGSVIKCKDKATKEEVDKFFEAGMTNEEVIDQLNTNEKMITIEEGAWEKGSNPVVDYYIWNKEKPANFDDEITFVRGDKIPPESKSLNEARGLYISDYQNYLEQKWIEELRAKYVIVIDKKLLKTINGI
ncbi:MAG: peptidyl-prolyl cis-trans isomerase, partial [Draconibacterium sp.]|nr:peptidyl-prolyl cis-trans isomerase [Draconibacterium sp.]